MNQSGKYSLRANAGQWQVMIDQQKESGMSQKDFCNDQNIALSTFTNWKRKLESKPVTIPKTDPAPPENEWIEISPEQETSPQPWHLELELPGGVILRMRQ